MAAEATTASCAILTIDPATASTTVGYYVGGAPVARTTLDHGPDLRDRPLLDQLDEREQAIAAWLDSVDPHAPVDAVAGTAGPLRPVPAGTYRVTDDLIADARAEGAARGPAALGVLLAKRLADAHGADAYTVDPMSTDELDPVARISGLADLPRRSRVHALAIRAIAARDAAEQGVDPAAQNLIVAHLDEGLSIAALRQGRLVDVTNADEEGPFSPDRTGGLPTSQTASLIFGGRFADLAECRDFLTRRGGLYAYLGTDDLEEVERRIQAGDVVAAGAAEAMAYQIGKEIGAFAAALEGRVDAILLTGALAQHGRTVDYVREMVGWIAPVRVHDEADRPAALVDGVRAALTGTVPARDYATEALA